MHLGGTEFSPPLRAFEDEAQEVRFVGQAFYLLNHPAGPHRLFESSTFSILSLTFASSVLLFVCLFLVAILTRVTESFVVVLICISLAASDTEHFFFFLVYLLIT